ncbi:MAG: hypothetical protein Q9215_004710 [Flavoplaca cf. flavocitrina]
MDYSTQAHSTHSCVQCGEAATSVCAACRDSPEDAWSDHKLHCKALAARKTLYRAADTAQALFYVFREIAFDKLVTKVERVEGQIRLFEGLYQDEVLVPFPNSLITDANEKKAVLSYLSCSDTCGYMDVLLKTMLGGISSKFTEISFKLKAQHPLKLRMIDMLKEDTNDYQHDVLKVRLKDGSSYVIDLAGAQYGHNVPVMQYDKYLKTMARDTSSPIEWPFGLQRAQAVRRCAPQIAIDPRYTHNIDIPKANEQLYQTFNRFLDSWQKTKMPLKTMLKLQLTEYLNNQQHLAESARTVLQGAADKHLARIKAQKPPHGLPKAPSPVPMPDLKTRERKFEEDYAESLRSALAKGHRVFDISGMDF